MIETKEGYARNALGHLVPLEQVREIDKLRDELVERLVAGAKEEAARLREFIGGAKAELAAFRELSAQEHGIKLAGRKGGFSLSSYDGARKVVFDHDDVITFNEKVSIAREQIFRCIDSWAKGSSAKLAALVARAFETDKQGHLSAAKIMSLRGLKIDDPEWEKAMAALDEGIVAAGTKAYVRFYEKDNEGAWRQIAVNA
jgi:hypothetical protein